MGPDNSLVKTAPVVLYPRIILRNHLGRTRKSGLTLSGLSSSRSIHQTSRYLARQYVALHAPQAEGTVSSKNVGCTADRNRTLTPIRKVLL